VEAEDKLIDIFWYTIIFQNGPTLSKLFNWRGQGMNFLGIITYNWIFGSKFMNKLSQKSYMRIKFLLLERTIFNGENFKVSNNT
jgi:hypothetical protein